MRPPPDPRRFQRYPVTTATCVLAGAVTIAGWLGVDVSLLAVDAHVRRGEVWRFLTSVFPHVGPIHLGFNVYWTWVFGTLVEETFGPARTAAVIVLFGVVSSAAEYAVFRGGVGLSGVGYGLFGMLWMLARHDRRFLWAVDARTVRLFVVWFFVCIALTTSNLMPVANVAHGVGALLGVAVGEAIAGRRSERLASVGAAALFVVASLLGATVLRSSVNRSPTLGEDEARLGFAALEEHRDAEGARWLEEATSLAPTDARAWHNLGVAYARLGRLPEAREAFRRAAVLRPGDADVQRALESVR